MTKPFAAMQMIDVKLPTTDGRGLVLTRYTEPKPAKKTQTEAARQPPPKITAAPPTPL
jgi:hypothetical protein